MDARRQRLCVINIRNGRPKFRRPSSTRLGYVAQTRMSACSPMEIDEAFLAILFTSDSSRSFHLPRTILLVRIVCASLLCRSSIR
jgi:hypothetical protein